MLSKHSAKEKSQWTAANIDAMKYDTLKQENQRKTLLQILGSQDLSDVTFKIGEDQTEFNLNRVFLAMISPVFKAMLYGQMQEAQPNSDVIIEDITPDVFECIIHFAYCNDPKITSQNVLSVLSACDKYQITKLQGMCYEFFKSNLNSSNFLSYYYTAKHVGFFDWVVIEALKSHLSMYYNECLPNDEFCAFFEDVIQSDLYGFVSVCESFLGQLNTERTTSILESEGFLQMSLESMLSFLKQVIGCKEEDIWESVMKWAVHQTQLQNSDDDVKENETSNLKVSSAATELLKSMKGFIRFGLMDGRYFTEKVTPLNVLTDQEMITVLKYFQCPEGGCSPFSTTPRKARPFEEIKYTVSFSQKHGCASAVNTCESLMDRDLSKGCGAVEHENPYIEATFDQAVIHKVEIGGIYTGSGWGGKYLNGAQIETAEGKVIATLSGHEESGENPSGDIETVVIDFSVITAKLRITMPEQKHLGIGFLKLYGRKLFCCETRDLLRV